MKDLLTIKNLTVGLKKKIILNDINLNIKEGEVHVLIGPNGSGKSTLASAIMGLSPFKIIEGDILLENKNITKLPPEQRFLLGISLVFQNPPPIKGVTLQELSLQIQKKLKTPSELIFFSKEVENLKNREINVGFSGGEKKIAELYQISLNKNNRLIIFDEIDSGLDLEKTKLVIDFVKKQSKKNKIAFLIITHREELLKLLNPSKVEVILNGKILCSLKDWRMAFKTIKKYGYEKCKTCTKTLKYKNE